MLLVDGTFSESGEIHHRAAIGTDFQVRDRDGRADVADGLAYGTLVELLR